MFIHKLTPIAHLSTFIVFLNTEWGILFYMPDSNGICLLPVLLPYFFFELLDPSMTKG